MTILVQHHDEGNMPFRHDTGDVADGMGGRQAGEIAGRNMQQRRRRLAIHKGGAMRRHELRPRK